MKLFYDHIIVGGGTSGCIVAAKLAEADKKVALFEAGPSDENNILIKDISKWDKLLYTELDYQYPVNNSNIIYSRGKVLGGCDSHNSGIAFETPDEDLIDWVNAGAEGWDPENVKFYFKNIRKRINFERARDESNFVKSVFKSANESGLKNISFNRGDNDRIGIGWFDLKKKGIIRQSSSSEYLHPLSDWKDRITFYLETQVNKLIINDDKRVLGVNTSKGNFFTSNEIIICCGAIDTPKLLLLSGIGDQEYLKSINIEVVHHLPGVGMNLMDHPETVINWELKDSVVFDLSKTTTNWEIGIFDKISDPEELRKNSPNIMMHLGTVPFDINTKLCGYPTSENGFCLTPNIMRPKSRGFVKLNPINPNFPPLIELNYFDNNYDKRLIIAGFKKAREIANQFPLKKWIKRELSPGIEVQTDEEIFDYIKKTCNTVYHACGTCKMGRMDDKSTVVDSQLKVKGIKGLRIADASIFPTIVGVNPCITVMMVGEKCSDFIINERKLYTEKHRYNAKL